MAAGAWFLRVKPAPAWAQSDGALRLLRAPKLALVLGNGDYKDAPLRNAVNDARAIGDALVRIGFKVTEKLDATRAEMLAAIRAYTRSLAARKCVGLFYYAGHGVQLAWTNYLVPVDAAIDRLEDVPKQAVAVTTLVGGITKAANPMNVIILDACRDNPFARQMKRTVASRSIGRGLGRVEPEGGTLVAYAAKHGETALDGSVGNNSPFVASLVKHLPTPGMEINKLFRVVRDEVMAATGRKQEPFIYGSLPSDDFHFAAK
jgi:uncharacterized caspase-like protein